MKDTSFAWQRQSRIIISLLWIALIVVVGATAIFYLLTNSTQKKFEAAAATTIDLQRQLDAKQDDLKDGKTFQAQTANLKTLVNNHVYLSPLLDELSKSTFVRAKFLNFDANILGKINLEGFVNDYGSLGKFLLGLSTSDKFQNIKLKSVTPSTSTANGYQFSLELAVKTEIFNKK